MWLLEAAVWGYLKCLLLLFRGVSSLYSLFSLLLSRSLSDTGKSTIVNDESSSSWLSCCILWWLFFITTVSSLGLFLFSLGTPNVSKEWSPLLGIACKSYIWEELSWLSLSYWPLNPIFFCAYPPFWSFVSPNLTPSLSS